MPGRDEIASLMQRFPKREKVAEPEVDLVERLEGSREVEQTYSLAQAQEEASRGVECGGAKFAGRSAHLRPSGLKMAWQYQIQKNATGATCVSWRAL